MQIFYCAVTVLKKLSNIMETSSTPNKNGSYGSDLGDKVTFEFDVRLPANGDTQQTATRLRSFLRQMPGIDRFIVEPEKQSVLIVTKKQSRDIQQAIEEVTGVPAVLKGMGAGDETGKEHLGAAVAIVTQNGDELDKTSVVGVARFLQTLSTGGSVIDATIDGLPPRKRINLGIGEYGDISRGCASCGPLAVDAIGHDSAILGGAETDDNGRLSFRTTKNELKVGDIIGRSLILFDADGPTKNSSRSSPPPSSPVLLQRFGCGIVARSAGLFENTKRVCSCSGKSLWEERQEAKAAAATTSTTPAVAAAAMGNKF